MRNRLVTGLAAVAGGVEGYYAVRVGQEIVQSQLADPVVDGLLWPVSVVGAVTAVLLGSGILLIVSTAVFAEAGVRSNVGKGNFSWHGAGGMFGAGAGFAVPIIAVFTPAISISANSLTPLISYALVATPLALSSWKLWVGSEPDIFHHSADDECKYDVETIREKTSTLDADEGHPSQPATGTHHTEIEPSNDQTTVQTSQEPADTELEYDWQNDTDVTFRDVGGMNEEKTELRTSVISPLNCPQKADALGVHVSNVILHGPPGTGKSHLAKALASELDVPAVLLSGADIQSKWINESASKVNDLFSEAEQVAVNKGGALVFVDELDSVLQQRGSGGSSHAEDMKVVNEFLTHLENTDSNNIVFIGATNRLQELDDAGTRPGRIDTKIKIGKPDAETRAAILHTQLRDRSHSLPAELISNIAEETEGHVAADLTQLVDAAATEALQRGDDTIRYGHVTSQLR
jgi:AAA+ superfamily predicted ATPase